MRKALKAAAVAALAAAAVAGGWAWRKRGAAAEADAGALLVVAPERLEATVEANGSVTPLNRIAIKPPISGRVDRLLAAEGDAVRPGQVLAWMSSSDRAAVLDAARAKGPEELKRWEDAYKPTPILSPLNGVVILRNVVEGETVDAGTTLYAVSDKLIVVAQVDEADIGRIRKGMPARVVLDAYPDRPAEAKVFDILYEGRNVSNVITYGVKLSLDKVPDFFRSQMTATVKFVTGAKENALVVPVAAVREGRSGRKKVLVPGPDGKPVPREVVTGLEAGDRVEVVSGLAAGEKVYLTAERYTPQHGPQSSPLTFGGPRQRGQGGGGGKRGGP